MSANQITLERALELHGLKELPKGWLESEIPFFLRSTQELIDQYGEDWIKQNQVRLREELEILANF